MIISVEVHGTIRCSWRQCSRPADVVAVVRYPHSGPSLVYHCRRCWIEAQEVAEEHGLFTVQSVHDLPEHTPPPPRLSETGVRRAPLPRPGAHSRPARRLPGDRRPSY